MQKITPCLWFDNQAEEAMRFYTSIFKNSKTGALTYYGDAFPGPKGSVLTATFQIEGQEFIALNGGPEFKFSEAISFMVNCDTQKEIDYYWEKLTAEGGRESQCGWLKDKFGVSWQIVPSNMPKLIDASNQKRSNRVMRAIMKMVKIDLAQLQDAYDDK